ncbi:flavodoxin family protein [Pseudoalteromonas ruthenica]|uniref:flavodoxin family protein n=1 Tax=Pseudoalteromonas ruthenica TaxID=151081 RepID=UPI001244C79A|nr:NAD(P)H-dependent oxidoreductase [Pseudoalteromonas ruthenica]
MNQHVIIFSSARSQGNTRQAADTLARHLGAQFIDLDAYQINPYRYDIREQSDDFRALITRLLEFDHWVFASPVYWYSTTPQMKAFFDRLTEYMDQPQLRSQLRQLRTKQASLLSTSYTERAPQAFVDPFIHTATYLGMQFVTHYHAGAADPESVAVQYPKRQMWWRKLYALLNTQAGLIR